MCTVGSMQITFWKRESGSCEGHTQGKIALWPIKGLYWLIIDFSYFLILFLIDYSFDTSMSKNDEMLSSHSDCSLIHRTVWVYEELSNDNCILWCRLRCKKKSHKCTLNQERELSCNLMVTVHVDCQGFSGETSRK